jgi:hypothetical protein
MQRVKIVIPGSGVTVCLSYWEVIKRIKDLDSATFVDYAYQGDGYIGFDLETGNTVGNPGQTTIKLYEIDKNNELGIQDLRNHFRQNWHRLQRKIEERVQYFYAKNYQVS